jgi:uncharacterized Zn finger protein (UPF0148 family)
MLDDEQDGPIICYNCDAEFIVHTPYKTEESVCFCPYCGSEVEGDDEEMEDDLFDELDPR